MSPAVRTKALAAVAAGAVLYLAITTVQEPTGSSPPTGAADAAPTASAVVVLAGAPRDLDRAGLRERYEAIGAAKPFVSRSFDPPRRERSTPVERPSRPALGERQPVSRPKDPEKVDLRFTGLLGAGEARRAVLEEASGTGLGLVAGAGLSLGPVSVSAVGTESITLLEGDERKDLALGSSIELPIAVKTSLQALKATTGDVAAVTTGAGGSASSGDSAAPAVSAEERQAVLERLRERRRRSISGGGE